MFPLNSLNRDNYLKRFHKRLHVEEWAEGLADRSGYAVRFLPFGREDEVLGSPTPRGIFTGTG